MNLWASWPVAQRARCGGAHQEEVHKVPAYRGTGEVGLTVERIAHANTLLFPIGAAVLIARKWLSKLAADTRSDLRALPPIVNSWLAKVLSMETILLQRVELRFGLSVICVARKGPANP